MSKVTSLQEARAKRREKKEHQVLLKISAMKFGPDAIHIAKASPKTMQHGVDLTLAIARVHKLQIEHGFVRPRLDYAIDEDGMAIVLVDMPDGIYCVGNGSVDRLDRWPSKIVETTSGANIGRWVAV